MPSHIQYFLAYYVIGYLLIVLIRRRYCDFTIGDLFICLIVTLIWPFWIGGNLIAMWAEKAALSWDTVVIRRHRK